MIAATVPAAFSTVLVVILNIEIVGFCDVVRTRSGNLYDQVTDSLPMPLLVYWGALASQRYRSH